MKNKMTMFELNEKYSAYPTRTSEYEIDGKNMWYIAILSAIKILTK